MFWRRAIAECERISGTVDAIQADEEFVAMVGILVHGNNHFILSGPEPTEAEAIRTAREFSVVQIGAPVANSFEQWTIRNEEFRENLEWAVVVPGEGEISPGVSKLLGELVGRGVVIRACTRGVE